MLLIATKGKRLNPTLAVAAFQVLSEPQRGYPQIAYSDLAKVGHYVLTSARALAGDIPLIGPPVRSSHYQAGALIK